MQALGTGPAALVCPSGGGEENTQHRGQQGGTHLPDRGFQSRRELTNCSQKVIYFYSPKFGKCKRNWMVGAKSYTLMECPFFFPWKRKPVVTFKLASVLRPQFCWTLTSITIISLLHVGAYRDQEKAGVTWLPEIKLVFLSKGTNDAKYQDGNEENLWVWRETHPWHLEKNLGRSAANRTKPCPGLKTHRVALGPGSGSIFSLESVWRGHRVKKHLWRTRESP